MSSNANDPSGGRGSAAQKAAQMRKKQAAAERRRRIVIVGAVVVAVLAVAAAGGVALYLDNKSETDAKAAEKPATSVPHFNDEYGITFNEGAPAQLVLYEDFQCPACRQAEAGLAPSLKKLEREGVLSVEYRMMAFLDAASSTRYSTRSLNAAQCVADDAGKDAWRAMHTLLYANQPAEGGAGLPDETLIEFAKRAGASDVESCITDLEYEGWAVGATKAAQDAGITGTPTMILNGEELDMSQFRTYGDFEQAIYEAAGQKPSGNGAKRDQPAN